ncbi:unnamed protein product [Blepharisma stoltei]|uniref:Uncharacterized protein n=1 Tax=Blepharisma stoltei TaxID=1481888 RepID=A0AAU9JQA2_9CILI|nr:unnamed protein product [Blepharisma stoltei]
MKISSRCLVIGAPQVGKTSFISQYLYSYLPPNHSQTIHPKVYKYTLSFPPPALCLEIDEIIFLSELPDFSSAILLYDPKKPETLMHLKETLEILKSKTDKMFGCIMVALVTKRDRLGKGKALAKSFGVKFLTADIKSRDSVQRCFAFSLKWARKNLIWEARKNALALRESLKSFRLV